MFISQGEKSITELFSPCFYTQIEKKSVLNGVRQGIALKEPLSVHKRRELFYYVTRSL